MQKIEYMVYYVTCNGQEMKVKDVKFIDVEEDLNGHDIVTFEYKGEVHKSYVRTYPSEDWYELPGWICSGLSMDMLEHTQNWR